MIESKVRCISNEDSKSFEAISDFKQMKIDCSSSLTPKTSAVDKLIEYDNSGAGKTFKFDDFFTNNKAPGCKHDCSIQDS